jgi:hypothetical protein
LYLLSSHRLNEPQRRVAPKRYSPLRRSGLDWSNHNDDLVDIAQRLAEPQLSHIESRIVPFPASCNDAESFAPVRLFAPCQGKIPPGTEETLRLPCLPQRLMSCGSLGSSLPEQTDTEDLPTMQSKQPSPRRDRSRREVFRCRSSPLNRRCFRALMAASTANSI